MMIGNRCAIQPGGKNFCANPKQKTQQKEQKNKKRSEGRKRTILKPGIEPGPRGWCSSSSAVFAGVGGQV